MIFSVRCPMLERSKTPMLLIFMLNMISSLFCLSSITAEFPFGYKKCW